MDWLNTTGGPFICGDAVIAENWQGIFGSSGARDMIDYERACRANRYMKTIPCGDGKLAVLGDEPLQSALFVNSKNEIGIVRWFYSNTPDVDGFIFNASQLEEIEDRIEIPLLSGWLVLFDSSSSLELCEAGAVGRMRIDQGTYAITAEKLEIPKERSFIIHRFLRI